MPTSTRASPNPARVALSPRDGYRFMMSVAGLSKNTKMIFLLIYAHLLIGIAVLMC
jgi:hypothetical protein